MELNHLKAFYEVAQSRSFSEAARRLRISQSALSKAVGLLEDREGVRLFQRGKKGVTLTSVGEEVYQRCEQVFQILSEVETTMRGKKETFDGPLRIAASDHIVNYFLVQKVVDMRREHPGMIPQLFSVTPGEVIEMLLKNQVELGFFFTKIKAAGINYSTVTQVPMAVVCHPQILSRLTAKGAKALLKKIDYISSIKAQYHHHPSEDFLKSFGLRGELSLEANSQETQKRLCLAGAGIAYLARFMVNKELENKELTEIPVAEPTSVQIHLATRKDRPLSAAAKDFLKRI